MFRATKQRLRRWHLRRHGVYEEVDLPKQSFGVAGGAWTICTQALEASSIVYSFGVGTDISFDCALIDAFNVNVHAFDPTPMAKTWIASQSLPEKFHFFDYGVADFDGTLEFRPPRRTASSHYTPVKRYRTEDYDRPRFTGPVHRIATIVQRLGHRHVDLIKMDIEGGEYAVIQDLLKGDTVVHQLAVEFHHSYATIPFEHTISAIHRLRKHGFRIAHISPRTYEITFVKCEYRGS